MTGATGNNRTFAGTETTNEHFQQEFQSVLVVQFFRQGQPDREVTPYIIKSLLPFPFLIFLLQIAVVPLTLQLNPIRFAF